MSTDTAVLVIEDDEAIRELVESILRLDGYNVVGVQDGLEAMRKLEQMQPDIILLDIGLPTMDGEAFIAAYQCTHQHHVPVIGMSAYLVDPKLLSKLSGFIKKPFDVTQLRSAVQDVRLGYARV